MNPPMKTKPFPGEENLPSELLDTAPGRPALLQGGHPSEAPVPDGYFDELLDAARGTPAIPERPDSAGAKNARFSGGAGVPQRARDKTLPTGEVLIEPLPIAEVRAHALATANPSREVDLEAFVRDADVRRAATVPSLRVREAEEAREGAARRRRRLVGAVSGALMVTFGASVVYYFVNRNMGVSPLIAAAPSASSVPSAAPPPAPPAPSVAASPSGLASAVVTPPGPSAGAPTVAAVPPRAVAPSAATVAPAHVTAAATAPGPTEPGPRASATASGPVEPVPTSSKMRPF